MSAALARERGAQADPLRAQVDRYYTRKIEAHGPTPHGVDWSCRTTQYMRFAQLLKIGDGAPPGISINDFGCGYGELVDYLQSSRAGTAIDYLGIDLSRSMVDAAQRRHPGKSFVHAHASPRQADYTVASGVFNVKLRVSGVRWVAYVQSTLRELFDTSSRGLAVNFLAPREAHLPQTSALFRPEPQPWIGFCMQELGAEVQLIADYGMREYTLLIRRGR